MRNFMELLRARWTESRFVCVGLDSEWSKVKAVASSQTGFNADIVSATADLVCAFKPNLAFYEELGPEGIKSLKQTIASIHELAPDVPVILDYKRGDIGNINLGYVQEAFEYFKADAVTVHPYLGAEALSPFLDAEGKGIIVLCRTSNPGAGEFQDRLVRVRTGEIQEPFKNDSDVLARYFGWETYFDDTRERWYLVPLYQFVALQVGRHWNRRRGNCAVVAGATHVRELGSIRSIVGDGFPILIPGIGAQGGDVRAVVEAAQDSQGSGMIINASRSIIFASSGPDFAEAARSETQKLHHLINQYRKKEVVHG